MKFLKEKIELSHFETWIIVIVIIYLIYGTTDFEFVIVGIIAAIALYRNILGMYQSLKLNEPNAISYRQKSDYTFIIPTLIFILIFLRYLTSDSNQLFFNTITTGLISLVLITTSILTKVYKPASVIFINNELHLFNPYKRTRDIKTLYRMNLNGLTNILTLYFKEDSPVRIYTDNFNESDIADLIFNCIEISGREIHFSDNIKKSYLKTI